MRGNFRTALFVAWRHLFSKKRHSLVNIISVISAVGVLAGTAALIIVLSVFNGMEGVVLDSFNSFNPDYKITCNEGKSFAIDTFPLSQIAAIEGVNAVEEVVSDLALVEYDDKQYLLELKGVSGSYGRSSGFGNLLIDGEFLLQDGNCEFGVLGAIAAGSIQLNLQGAELYKVFYPKRLRKNLANPTNAFNTHFLTPSGVFASYTEYDDKYLICSIDFARNLMNYDHEATAVEVFINNEKKLDIIQKQIEKIVGNQFVVKNRYQQEEMMFRTMKTEKMMIFAILSFILWIAVFNIIGTLSMIIIEKKEDIAILHYLGASRRLVRQIFMLEGMIISFIGGVVGMIIGWLVCVLQQTFHLISFGDGSGNYVIDYYPVKMNPTDFIIVFATVFIISFLVSVIPSHRLKN